ncbi:cytochrome P450 [Sphaerisporangium corydalis]|uniref:Cytochrome P450 n=1 Tax=Sphaerisporangium corydalis TaxID=1441875 RepID=A0ABV9E765_9ACTN|nr:cytochrome P450 [Sphaerisporangium corydalis]
MQEVSELIPTLFDQRTRPDPYPCYAALREREPVPLATGRGVMLGSFASCLAALRDRRLSSDRTVSWAYSGDPAATTSRPEIQSLLFSDPPDHTRLRRLMSHAFTPGMVERLRAFVRARIDDLIDAAAPAGRIEVVGGLAYPLPLSVIGHMLGVPGSDMKWLHARSMVLPRAFDPAMAAFGTPPPGHAERMVAEREMNAYFLELGRRRLRSPGDDLVSELAMVSADGDRLSERELADNCRLLLNAGHETTVNLIDNTLLALLRHPREAERLRADPHRASAIVEETMRWDSPVQILQRFVPRDLRFGEVDLRAGDIVVLLTAAAQRDPAAFADADAFLPDRTDGRHLGFGFGAHFCLGAALSRMELGLLAPRFFQRLVGPVLDESSVRYREQVALRGLTRMDVDFTDVRPRELAWPL